MNPNWTKDFNGAILVCDQNGIIIEMNDRAILNFAADGGRELIGKNLLDCHPESARSKLKKMMDKRETNIYTIEKNGRKKFIYQAPWYKDGDFAGLVELSLEIPFDMPHFIRENK